MPPKRTPTPTQRVIPYDLRRTHIPRVPTPHQSEPSSRPAGGYIPRSTRNQIIQMKRKATATGDIVARNGRGRSTAAPRNAVQKRVRFTQQPADDEAIPAKILISKAILFFLISQVILLSLAILRREEAEAAAVEALYHSKERLKEIVHNNRLREARRQLRETRDNSICTSDLEDEIEDRMRRTGDYQIALVFLFRLNKKLSMHKTLSDTTRHSFDITVFEETILDLIQSHLGDDDVDYEITGRTAVIRHTSGRGGSRRHDFNDFSLSEADRIMEIVEEHRANFRKGKLMITFEISAVKDAPTKQKRPKDDTDKVSSSPPPQPEKKRRGDHLRDQHTARLDAIRIAGDFQRQLMERWRCRDDNCTNKNNFCFPEPTDPSRHYNSTAPQHEMWSNSIARGEATIHLPSRKLLRYWKQNQGNINRLSRHPAKQTAIQQTRSTTERLAEMQQQMQEQMLQQRVFDQIEALEEKQERREERNERRQMQREQREFLQNHSYPGYLMQPQLPLHSPGQIPYTKPYNSTSNYIVADEDDADILALFFNWRISNTGNSDRRTKWQHAEMLSLEMIGLFANCNRWRMVSRPCISERYRPGFQMVLPMVSELSSTFLKRTIGSLKSMRRLHGSGPHQDKGLSRIPRGLRPRPVY
ncbi:hypothetical protein V1517DRAFT_308962 [Lipomyces orientalis]|uniref:Uncharacterized protein n=1 Tax=Lipomyces orientalis TaxID=1233043 RepID=A0ACC3TKA7_9ASCO